MSITQQLRTDLGRSVDVTITSSIQLAFEKQCAPVFNSCFCGEREG